MTEVTIRVDATIIEDAARALGIWENTYVSPAAMGARVMREVAGRRVRPAAADGGAAPKRAGRAWENVVVAEGQAAGLPWSRARLRGSRDLLDVEGSLPGGWLVGAKSSNRGQSAAVKLFDAMDQCERAMAFLDADGKADGVIPWQIIKRPGAEPRRAYAVTEFGWMLELCQLRQSARETRAW